MCEIHKLHKSQIVNYSSVQAEIIKLTNIVNFFAINCHFTGKFNPVHLAKKNQKN